ncbi:patatin-like phospholipase family protein [Sphaerotilus montanus]|uniref:patatin-like phospholipase family protein n=1 Tax=Sphaerotilus montanus TaxID=522889 RepID=UPI003FA21D2F
MGHRYARCLVMAGGGFRFGYYLGLHAALAAQGRAPDVLLASCGGAIAAAVIQALAGAGARRDWLASPAMHAFCRSLQARPGATLGGALAGALARFCNRQPAPRVPDLFNDYLFELPARLPLPAAPDPAPGPAVAFIAGTLLYGEHEVGQPRGARPLFAETVLCDARTAALLQGGRAPMDDPRWGHGVIAPDLRTVTDMPVADAVRASIADMFYFRCHAHAGRHYLGGAIDLVPVEIARQLANEVFMEHKAPYDHTLATPALRAVLGVDGHRRMRHVMHADLHAHPGRCNYDTSDMRRALPHALLRKRLRWAANRIELAAPEQLSDYRRLVDAQWHYGHQCGQRLA